MPRRGWNQVEVPSGWIQVLRGPRPKSVLWASAEKTARDSFGRVGRLCRSPCIAECVEVCPTRIRGETCRCAGEGMRSFHRQVPESVGQPRARARQRTGDVGCRYSTVGETSGNGVRRSSNAATTVCSSNVRNGGRDQAFAQTGGCHGTGATLFAQACKRQATSRTDSSARIRFREDFVPMYDEDILRWMQDRQADARSSSGRMARLCHVLGTAATSWSTPTPSMVSNTV